eukprot:XP_001689841.1 predicted protein [Chlamydomonas reinhardtii]
MPSSPRSPPTRREGSYANLARADAGEQMISTGGRIVRAKRYGGRFGNGFLDFLKTSELADCTVVGPNGQEYRLHSLLLAYHSEFFRRALGSEFAEGAARRIVLGFEDSGDTWPLLIEYFYTEEITLTDANVLALFAASRELLIPAIQDFCADFAQNSLEPSNALSFLRQAVQYNCDAFRTSCVTLVATSFNTCCGKSTDGLPVEVIQEILDHPQLFVQTEEQVLLFVQNYVRRHQLDDATVRQLFRGVRLPFLSNDRLAALAAETPGHGPPIEFICIPMELVWEELATNLTVCMSGDTVEGDADSILRTSSSDSDTGAGSWFTVSSEDPSRPVWVEIAFPPCMRVVELSKYTFSHGMNMIAHMFPYGISDSSWFQMKGMSTHVSPGDEEPFTPLRTQDSCQQHTEYVVTVDPAHSKQVVWRRLRILAGDENAQQQVRLSIRKLKLYGRVEDRDGRFVAVLQPRQAAPRLTRLWEVVLEELACGNRALRYNGGGDGGDRAAAFSAAFDAIAPVLKCTGGDAWPVLMAHGSLPAAAALLVASSGDFDAQEVVIDFFAAWWSAAQELQLLQPAAAELFGQRGTALAAAAAAALVVRLWGHEELAPSGRGRLKNSVTLRLNKVLIPTVFVDMVVNWERPALSDAELAKLEKAAQSNGLYLLRVKADKSELLSSVPASCLLGDKLFEKAEVAVDRGGQLLSFNYAITDCAKRAAGTATGASAPSPSEEGVGTRPPSLPVRVVLPRPGPALLVPEFVGDFVGAKPRAPVQGQAARKGAPPPKDERTWLQKNWMFVLAGAMMVFNMVMKANAPEAVVAARPFIGLVSRLVWPPSNGPPMRQTLRLPRELPVRPVVQVDALPGAGDGSGIDDNRQRMLKRVMQMAPPAHDASRLCFGSGAGAAASGAAERWVPRAAPAADGAAAAPGSGAAAGAVAAPPLERALRNPAAWPPPNPSARHEGEQPPQLNDLVHAVFQGSCAVPALLAHGDLADAASLVATLGAAARTVLCPRSQQQQQQLDALFMGETAVTAGILIESVVEQLCAALDMQQWLPVLIFLAGHCVAADVLMMSHQAPAVGHNDPSTQAAGVVALAPAAPGVPGRPQCVDPAGRRQAVQQVQGGPVADTGAA